MQLIQFVIVIKIIIAVGREATGWIDINPFA